MTVDFMDKQDQIPFLRRAANLDAISAMPGVKLQNSHRATFIAGKLRAEVHFPTTSELQLTALPMREYGAQEALELTRELPGNLRFALKENQLTLTADVLTEPSQQLGDRFAEVIQGLGLATQQQNAVPSTKQIEESELTTQQILEALQSLGWDSQSVVELPAGWELRPIVANRPSAVKVFSESGVLRFRQVVVSRLKHSAVPPAVYDQTLRLNRQLRHARLALDEGKIVAETRLHLSHFLLAQLAGSAQAVAVAACHARGILEILNTHADIAACYASMFCCEADGDESVVAT